MTIYVINGAPGTGKTFISNAIRNISINQGRGALMIDEDNDGELAPLIEKLIKESSLPDIVTDIDVLPWKAVPNIVFVGEKRSVLQQIEKRVPGFIDKFGPIFNIAISKELGKP